MPTKNVAVLSWRITIHESSCRNPRPIRTAPRPCAASGDRRRSADADDEETRGLDEIVGSSCDHLARHPGGRDRPRRALDGGLNAVVHHRAAHNTPAIPCRISASVGVGFCRAAPRGQSCPFWQNPHAGTCSSIHACCSGGACRRRPTLERGDLGALHGGDRQDARAHGVSADDHGAEAALAQATAEPRPVQVEIVAKDIEKRRRRIDVSRSRLTVDSQCDAGHCFAQLLPRRGARPCAPRTCQVPAARAA